MASRASNRSSKQIDELRSGKPGLTRDGLQCSGGQVPISMHWHDDQTASAGLAKIVMTSTNVAEVEASLRESGYQSLATDSWQPPAHATATSRSRSSTR